MAIDLPSRAPVLDLVEAWRRRGWVVPVPPRAGDLEKSTVGAKARVVGRQLVVDVYDTDMEPLGKLVFTPELARDWGHFFSAHANKCWRDDHRAQRVAEGLCGTDNCKRKLVVGTERCRKCGEQIAARQVSSGGEP